MIVFKDEGRTLTTSLKVADVFSKNHNHVLRDIENLDCSREFTQSNFGLSEYEDSTGRKLPVYTMTRDGWTFLVMGYRGMKAAKFKEDYIEAFNRMELSLTCPSIKTLCNPQALIWFEKTNIELIKEWVEIYTKPLEKHEPALSFNFLHQTFNGWMTFNRYKYVSKPNVRRFMKILGYHEVVINGYLSYLLSIKKDFRQEAEQ